MSVLLHWWILESVIMTSLHGNNDTIEIKVFEGHFWKGVKSFHRFRIATESCGVVRYWCQMVKSKQLMIFSKNCVKPLSYVVLHLCGVESILQHYMTSFPFAVVSDKTAAHLKLIAPVQGFQFSLECNTTKQ